MSDSLPANLAAKLSKARITPEQAARRKEVDERNAVLQERGVPAPKSGTFGGGKKAEKK